MGSLLYYLFLIVMTPISAIIRGLVTLKLYTWFVVTSFAAAPALDLTKTIGLMLFLGVFHTVKSADVLAAKNLDETDKIVYGIVTTLFNAFLLPLMALLIAAVFRAIVT